MLKRTIYLADYAKDQLETSNNASIWSKPIPYKNDPESGFTLELTLEEEELEYGPLEGNLFHPDRSEPETIVELLEKVELPKPKRKKVTIKPGDQITVHLHGADVTSEEEFTVEKVGRKYLYIDVESGPSKFDMRTGKCIDDNTSFRFYRTIDRLL